MSSWTRPGFAVLLALFGAPALSVPLNGDFSMTADDADGRSFTAELSLSPNDHVTLNVGAGHSSGSDEASDLRGTLLNAGVSLHGKRAGLSLGYDRFDDSSNYRSATASARAWITAGDFEFSLLGRQREMGVEFTLTLPQRTLRREQEFSAVGGGLQIAFSHGNFDAYVMALEYDYDDGLDRFLEFSQSPQLPQRPRIEALVGSFITQAQGAIDRQSAIGVEQSFGRNAIGLDVSQVHDAIIDSSSLSVALTWRHAYSAHLDFSVSGGMIDSDQYGKIGFAGVSVGIAN